MPVGNSIRAATQKGRKFAYLIIRADYAPSCLDDFVHLRLNPFEQDSRSRGRRSRKARSEEGERDGFEYSVKTDLSHRVIITF